MAENKTKPKAGLNEGVADKKKKRVKKNVETYNIVFNELCKTGNKCLIVTCIAGEMGNIIVLFVVIPKKTMKEMDEHMKDEHPAQAKAYLATQTQKPPRTRSPRPAKSSVASSLLSSGTNAPQVRAEESSVVGPTPHAQADDVGQPSESHPVSIDQAGETSNVSHPPEEFTFQVQTLPDPKDEGQPSTSQLVSVNQASPSTVSHPSGGFTYPAQSIQDGLETSEEEYHKCVLLVMKKDRMRGLDALVFKSVRLILFALYFLIIMRDKKTNTGYGIAIALWKTDVKLTPFSNSRRMQTDHLNSPHWPSKIIACKITGLHFIMSQESRDSFEKEIGEEIKKLYVMLDD